LKDTIKQRTAEQRVLKKILQKYGDEVYVKKIKIIIPYLLTYLLHGAESFLRSYLVLQLVKKFPAFCGTRRFITAFTSARHLSLS
jgi:hypothetical protein